MSTKIINLLFKTKGAKEATRQFGKIGGSIASLATKWIGLSAVVVGGVKLIQSATEKYKIQELAEKRLEVALGRRSKALLTQAAALQKSTSFADEEIIVAQQLIASFVKEEDAIKKATEATLDLAAAKGFDLKAAADLVSKTLGSSTNALTRYGISVEGAVGSTERLNSLTKNIATAFGGQAEAAMETMAGRSEDLSNSWGDLLEKGGRLIDIVDRMAGGQAGLARKLDATADELEVIGNLLERVFGKPSENQITAQERAVQRLKDAMALLTDEQRQQVKEQGKHLSGKIRLAEALIKENQSLSALIEKEKEFKKALVEKIEKQEQEKTWTDEVTFALWRQNEAIAANIDVSKVQIRQGEELGEIWQFASEQGNQLHDDWLDAQLGMMEVSQQFGDMFASVLERSMMSNQDFFMATIMGFKNMIAQMLATLTANAAIFGFLNLLGVPGASNLFGGGSLLGLLGFRATGGPVDSGKPYIVGEQGPELFIPHDTGTILPNENVGQNVVVNLNGPIMGNAKVIARELAPELQQIMRRGEA